MLEIFFTQPVGKLRFSFPEQKNKLVVPGRKTETTHNFSNLYKIMQKKIYQNKKTGQIIVTGETLDKNHWKFIRKAGEMKTKNVMIKNKETIKK